MLYSAMNIIMNQDFVTWRSRFYDWMNAQNYSPLTIARYARVVGMLTIHDSGYLGICAVCCPSLS